MKTNRRYLTTLLIATAATGAAIGLAPVALAAPGASEPLAAGQSQVGPGNTPPEPGYWDGGQAAGGTGVNPGPDTATGPSTWRGGQSAGGTGIDSGPDTASGPTVWSGGQSAGAF
jgi:hypothetical protein